MNKFEGFEGNEESTGSSIFHPKNSPTKVTTKSDNLPPGHPEFHGPKRPIKSKGMPSTFA